MGELYLFNNKIESIFQLLGEKENDISYSVGWAFANCRKFLELFLKHLKIKVSNLNKVKIHLQTFEKTKGFTDFEIVSEGEFHIIIEAKRGWIFPSKEQLSKYATRQTFTASTTNDKRIIIFNESTPSFTLANFQHNLIGNINIEVISWRELQIIAAHSICVGRDSENKLIRDLILYLNKIISMQNKDSNWVYIVSLGGGTPNGWNISWRDIVNKEQKYFHPVGGNKKGWPPEPPNYIAFRYGGLLQSIHHIDNYEVFLDPSLHFKNVPKGNWSEHHYLYHLGPAIKPINPVISGTKIVRSMRVWAMLDLLLTSKTIEEARDKSKLR